MPTDDSAEAEARAALELLKSRLQDGLRATPLCLAVVGWLCDAPADPSVAEARRMDDGRVWLRLSDEAALAPLCSYLEFLGQIRIVCQSVGTTEGQTRATVTWARERLG